MNWLADLSPYLMLIAAGFLPNEVWRMLGYGSAAASMRGRKY